MTNAGRVLSLLLLVVLAGVDFFDLGSLDLLEPLAAVFDSVVAAILVTEMPSLVLGDHRAAALKDINQRQRQHDVLRSQVRARAAQVVEEAAHLIKVALDSLGGAGDLGLASVRGKRAAQQQPVLVSLALFSLAMERGSRIRVALAEELSAHIDYGNS